MSNLVKAKREGFALSHFVFFSIVTLATALMCISLGSVNIDFVKTLRIIGQALLGKPIDAGMAGTIILTVRLPRVVCVALSGAALSLCGAAMQGLMRNPLADGATLGVSSGAALGAVVAIMFGMAFPLLPYAATTVMAIVFAFLSLMLILALAYLVDSSLATHSIILMGVIFTMFLNSIMSLLITFSGEKLKSITFWTMGSLAGTTSVDAWTLFAALAVGGTLLIGLAQELNAFALGEENARHLGVNVKRVKLTVLIVVSLLIGISVSIGGSIGFVGLVVPHMARLLVGPNHKRLLPASMYMGAVFLMLCDMCARVILRPIELPIGVVTSLCGAVTFVAIFYRTRRAK